MVALLPVPCSLGTVSCSLETPFSSKSLSSLGTSGRSFSASPGVLVSCSLETPFASFVPPESTTPSAIVVSSGMVHDCETQATASRGDAVPCPAFSGSLTSPSKGTVGPTSNTSISDCWRGEHYVSRIASKGLSTLGTSGRSVTFNYVITFNPTSPGIFVPCYLETVSIETPGPHTPFPSPANITLASPDDSAAPTEPIPLSASHSLEALLNELLSNPSMSTHCACPSSSRLSQHHFGYSQ